MKNDQREAGTGRENHYEGGGEKNSQYKSKEGGEWTEMCRIGRFPGADLLQESSAASIYIRNAEREELLRKARDPRIPAGGGHTEEEYLALPDDLRVELIDGVFYAMASPVRVHQLIAFEIARQLADCIEEHGREDTCFLFIAPSDVALGGKGNTVVQPDVYIHCDPEGKIKDDLHWGPPDFVVEVLSPSNPENDLWRKRELYKRHGVREYWIIDPYGHSVFVFLFEDEKHGEDPEIHTFEEVIPLQISEGRCKVDFTRIRRRMDQLQQMEESGMF